MKFLSVRLLLQTAFVILALGLFGSPILAAGSAQIASVTAADTHVQADAVPAETFQVMPPLQAPYNNNRFPLPEDFVLLGDVDPSGETNHDGFFLRIYPAGQGDSIRIFPVDPLTDYKLRVIPPSSPQPERPIELPAFAP